MGSISYLTQDSNTATQSVYTFSSKGLGGVATDRYVIVGISARKAGATGTLQSVTVAGVSATIVSQIQQTAGSNNSTIGLAIALVPSGTTGDIVVTLSEAFLRCGIGLWRATGIASATPYDLGTSTASAPTTSLDLPAEGGFMIGMSKIGSAGTCDWSGIDEDFDVDYQTFTSHSGAHKEFFTAQTNLTITATWSISNAPVGAFASWAYAPEPPPENWYNPSWAYRVKITVEASEVDSDLTDFPVYVPLASLPAGFHTNVKSDGGDIRVTTADEVTEVAREVVFYDAGSDTGELHFKAPNLSATTDTDFYIYYGNVSATEPATSDTYGRNNVWTGYKAVYHMQEDPTGTIVDSTGNGYDLTSPNLDSADLVTGDIGKAIKKDAGEYFTKSGGIPFSANDDITFQAILNVTSWGGANPGLWRSGATSNENYFNIFQGSTGRPWIRWGTGTDILKPASGYGVSLSTSTLVHFLVESAASAKFYADGNEEHSNTHSAATPAFDIYNLGYQYATNEEVVGRYDEVRLKAGLLTANWIATESNNLKSPGTFYSVGSEEAYIPSGGLIKVYNGSTWVEKPVKVWSGAEWVEKPVKVYNGAEWV